MSDSAMRDALAVLIGAPVGRLVSIEWARGVHRMAPPSEETRLVPWLHDSPAEALEALHTRGLYPWSPGEGPRWWVEKATCSQCLGRGTVVRPVFSGMSLFYGESIGKVRGPTPIGEEVVRCEACDGRGHTKGVRDAPQRLHDVVSVCSLSAPTLLRVVELAAEIARHAGCAEAALVWRVMGRETLAEATRKLREAWNPSMPDDLSDRDDIVGFAATVIINAASREADVARYADAWREDPHLLREATLSALPAIRDLLALGVVLVALDAQRIVIGVESVGGDHA